LRIGARAFELAIAYWLNGGRGTGRIMSDSVLAAVAARALEFVRDGMVVGLGTGRAATAFVEALGERVRQGALRITGVPTSKATADVARRYAIPLVGLDAIETIDVTCDGADEVDPHLNLIKGYGGALVPEKIVAAASRMEIILIGSEKLVPVLGRRGILPVEVIPFAAPFCSRRLAKLGCRPQLRSNSGQPFVSDSGNHILDCGIEPLPDPHQLEHDIRAIPGVVGTGLFLDMADVVLVGEPTGVRELR
jgi:ribose 5-phosphate isomerase A